MSEHRVLWELGNRRAAIDPDVGKAAHYQRKVRNGETQWIATGFCEPVVDVLVIKMDKIRRDALEEACRATCWRCQAGHSGEFFPTNVSAAKIYGPEVYCHGNHRCDANHIWAIIHREECTEKIAKLLRDVFEYSPDDELYGDP